VNQAGPSPRFEEFAAMAIAVSCACGKSFNVKDELAGKNIKCPSCQEVVTVPGGAVEVAEEPPAVVSAARSSSRRRDDDDDDYEDRPSKKKKRKSDDGEKKSSSMTLFILLGVGLLFGCVCLGGCGVGGYFLFFAGPGDPEKLIVGRWQSEVTFGFISIPSENMEFKSDGTFTKSASNNFTYTNGKWVFKNKDGRNLTVEVSYDETFLPFGGKGNTNRKTETYHIYFNNKNMLERKQNVGDEHGIRYRRL
jgi:hypothetical protein